MDEQQKPQRLRALLAAVTATAVIAIIPTVLLRLAGSPIPRTAPNIGRIRDALSGSVGPDDVATILVHLLAIVCWVSWTIIVVSLIGETVAAIQHRSTRTVRTIGGLQEIARVLVGTIAIGLASFKLSAPSYDALPARATAITLTTTAPTPVAHLAMAEPDTEFSHTVAARETLLDVAENRLGDASRWREIWTLNQGRTMNDGSQFDRPEILRRGWRLELPANTTKCTPVPATVAARSTTPDLYVVQPGDTLGEIIHDHQHRHATRAEVDEVFKANVGVRDWRGAHPLHDPNMINPGMHLDLAVLDHDTPAPTKQSPHSTPKSTPSTPQTTVTTTLPSKTSTSSIPPTTSTTVAPQTPTSAKPLTQPTTSSIPNDSNDTLALTSLVMLSAGALALGAALRRCKLRSAPIDAVIPATTEHQRGYHRALASTGENFREQRLANAIASLGDHTPQALRMASDGSIEAFLQTPSNEVPRPWRSSAGGQIALLDANARLATNPANLPRGLIHLGNSNDDTSVYIDLEVCENLTINAAGEQFDAVARAIAATLCATPHSSTCHLFCTGFDSTGIDPLSRRDNYENAALESRVVGWDDDEILDVVISTQPFLRAHQSGGAVTIITPNDSEEATGWSLTPNPQRTTWTLEPFGIEITPVGLALDELRELAGYYALANADLLPDDESIGDSDKPVEAPPRYAVPNASPEPDNGRVPLQIGLPGAPETLVETDMGVLEPEMVAVAEPVKAVSSIAIPAPPTWELMVRLLGPVDVVNRAGVVGDAGRPQAIEAIAWLAEHRETATREGLEAALWSIEVAPDHISNVFGRARRMLRILGPDNEGRNWFDKTMRLDERVITDADLVMDAIKRSESLEPVDAIALLTEAVELIRGVPLVNVDYRWADGEGLSSRLTMIAVRAAVALAELHFANNDFDATMRATEIGMRVLPSHETLVALRMRAHAVRGDLAAARLEYTNYERLARSDQFADGEQDCKMLAAVYQQLRREAADPLTKTSSRSV